MFGIDGDVVKKAFDEINEVLEDIAAIRVQQSEINSKLDEILSRLPEKSVSA